MKFNKTFFTLVTLLVVLCAFSTATIAQDESTNTNPISTTAAPPRSRFGSLFSNLLKPLRSTIEHAKNFLGHRIENVSDGYDMLRQRSFEMFTTLYNKTYSAEELPKRMKLFFERRDMIEESVKMFNEGKSTFLMRENVYTDWDDEELKALAGVSLPSQDELAREEQELSEHQRFARSVDFTVEGEEEDADDRMIVKQNTRIPASKDWRASGCIATPINQQKCGACYAVATMSVLESMRCINQVSSPILSPQQVVDCASTRAGYRNHGCDGGWPTPVLKYLQNTGIAARETCYPFVRRQGTCKLSSVKQTQGCTVSASPSDSSLRYKVLNNERDILYHVAKTGPVVTVMKASDKFLYYGSGIFDDPRCSRKRDDVDHAIVIVGYGRENGQDYWIIKNSWGVSEWGENGYGKYKRGTNACSIGHWGWVITS